jgi:hypothetical protein
MITTALVAARVINEDVPHRLRRQSEEVRPVLPPHLPLVDELEISLVHQGRRLPVTQISAGQAAQFILDEWR